MKEQLISFDTAVLAKKIGFDWVDDSSHWYQPGGNRFRFRDDMQLDYVSRSTYILCPSQAVLQRWLREKHGISVLVHLDVTMMYSAEIGPLHPEVSYQGNAFYPMFVHCAYEDALEVGLIEGLKLIKHG